MSNVVVLSLRWYDYSPIVAKTNERLNLMFTSIFTLEAIIKIYGIRSTYFRVGWNVFDFCVYCISLTFLFIG